MSDWLENGWLATVDRLASPNFGARPAGRPVSLIVIHNISLPPGEFEGRWVADFFLNRLDRSAHPYFETIADVQVSAHFYIERDGRIVQFVGCDHRAWHAGQSRWCAGENCNDYSIGVELAGSDDTPFAAAQYVALLDLMAQLRARYPITDVAGHSDVAPGRKTDPGPYFDWAAVAARFPDLALPPEVGT